MADFYTYRSLWDLDAPHAPGLSPDKFYEHRCRVLRCGTSAPELHRAMAEGRWAANEWSYYKVYDDMVRDLWNASMRFPFHRVEVPFDAFAVYFPRANSLALAGGREVQCMLVSVLPNELGGRHFTLWVECGDGHTPDGRNMVAVNLAFDADMEVDEQLAGLEASPYSTDDLLTDGLDAVCVRIAVSVCLLATGAAEEPLCPDVLAKDLAKWREAVARGDTAQQQTIEARARRRGKRGWILGGDGERHWDRREHGESETGGATRGPRGELRFRHARSAHFRLLASGKIVFVRPTIVRPDLPPRER
jgi:hypothetical protein